MLRYNARLKHPARQLRAVMTDAEQKLWSHLRRRQLLNVQFYRQKPIGDYIVDFYGPAAALVVEVDGGQHFEAAARQRDETRTAYLEAQGLRVLRFSNLEVLQQTKAVVEAVYAAVEARKKSD